MVKNLPPNAGDMKYTGLIPVLGRSPGGGHGNSLQCSCLENPMDRGARQATVHGIAKRDTPERLNKLGRSRSAWATYGTCEGILRPGGLEAWRMGPTRCGHRGLHLCVTPAAGCVLLGLAQAERALSLAAAELWPGPCAGLFPSSASRKP